MSDFPDWLWGRIPEHMRPGIARYVMDGIPGGSFMRAMLANDFLAIVETADEINIRSLYDWAKSLEQLPLQCWGSYEKVDAWVKAGGVNGGALDREA